MSGAKKLWILAILISFFLLPCIAIAEDFSEDIDGLFGIRWGDSYDDLLHSPQTNFRLATYSERAGYESFFTTGKSHHQVSYAADGLEMFGLKFDVLILTYNEKAVEIVGWSHGAVAEDYIRMKNDIIAKLGKPRSAKVSNPWFFKVLFQKQRLYWRVDRNAMSISFLEKIWGDTIQIWARGEG